MLSNKLALVTGAAKGIGESVAKILAREGALVTLADIEDCKPALQKIPNFDDHLSLKIDVTKQESVENVLQRIQDKYGKSPEIVVNSAGIINNSATKSMKNIYLLKMTDNDFDNIMDVNLKGTFNVNKIFANSMKKEEIKGNIVNISSIAGNTRNQNFTFSFKKRKLMKHNVLSFSH